MQRMVVGGIVLACAGFVVGGAVQQQRVGVEAAPTRTATPVEVTNFPAVQPVSGSVEVGNLPLDPDGSVRVAGLSAPATIRFVGFSQQTFLIPQTCCDRLPVFQMNRACDASFQGSRACDYLEMIRSIPPLPEFPVATPLIAMQGAAAPVLDVQGTCIHEDGTIGGCAGVGPFPVACCGF
jgi:hypothetical protein